MNDREQRFWDDLKEYEKRIHSVFARENILTDYLLKVPDRSEKVLIDFGCGPGNAIPYTRGFGTVHMVDYSDNMLSLARKKGAGCDNITYIRGSLADVHVGNADVVMAISSVFPESPRAFERIMENFSRNLKAEGEILLCLPSFESRTLFYHYILEWMLEQDVSFDQATESLVRDAAACGYSPFGYLSSEDGPVQKHWLKEEIGFRLHRLGYGKVAIDRLPLDWTTQVPGFENFGTYPNLWFWLVRIFPSA